MIDNTDKVEHIVIIGGGPAGLSSALYTARSNFSPLVFGGSPAGGQLVLTSEVENFPGIDSMLGPELITKMRNQAKKFGARILDQNIVKVDFMRKPFKIYTTESMILSDSVIIATGAKALWLGLDSETRLRGHGVSACATCDGFFFRNKIVAVIGGGDAAMEEAQALTNFANKIYLIHRRNMFRASKIMQERVFSNPKIEVIWNTEVEEILGENKVEGIRLKSVEISDQLKSGKAKRITNLKVDGVFVAIGHKPDTDIFKGQIELDDKGYIITSSRFASEYTRSKIQNHNIQLKVTLENSQLEKIKQEFDLNYNYITSVPGVFAAGDCVDFQYKQATTAAGQGVAAALEVENWLG